MTDIWDQYDHIEMGVAIQMAMRTQADTITSDGTLTVTLPHSEETVDLSVVAMGNIDPDIMSPEEMVDPATQDNNPIPGFIVDLSPLHGGEGPHHASLMLDPDNARGPASPEALAGYGVNEINAKDYLQSAAENGGVLPVMEIKYESGMDLSELVEQMSPATSAEFASVGMHAAAQELADPNPVQTPEVAPVYDPGFSGP